MKYVDREEKQNHQTWRIRGVFIQLENDGSATSHRNFSSFTRNLQPLTLTVY